MSQPSNKNLWSRFQRYYTEFPGGFALSLVQFAVLVLVKKLEILFANRLAIRAFCRLRKKAWRGCSYQATREKHWGKHNFHFNCKKLPAVGATTSQTYFLLNSIQESRMLNQVKAHSQSFDLAIFSN